MLTTVSLCNTLSDVHAETVGVDSTTGLGPIAHRLRATASTTNRVHPCPRAIGVPFEAQADYT